jgi:hypothetical protein
MARGPNAKAVAVEARIRTIRGHRVLLDADLAVLYAVTTKRLNEAVRRNASRFPIDFMFQLSADEAAALRSQTANPNLGRGGRRYEPYAFTEHGVAMLATVLRSTQAIAVSVEIIRAFVRLRRVQKEHADLAARLDELESKYDANFRDVFDAIRALMQPPSTPRRPIGFRPPSNRPKARHQTARLLGRAAGRRGMDGDGRSS